MSKSFEADQGEASHRFRLFQPYLLALANREMPTHVIVGCTGSDLVQNAFVLACERWEKLREYSSEELLSWLRAVIRFEVLQLRRKQKRELEANQFGSEAELPADVTTPLVRLEKNEDYETVLQILQELPELQRQIIEGRIEKHESFKEIGRRVGMKEDAARKAFDRAMERVQGHFLAATTLIGLSRKPSE